MTAVTGPVANVSPALQIKKDKAAVIEAKLLDLSERIAVFCPPGMTAAHVRHSVMVAIGQNAKLTEATAMSVVLSALVITQWGLDIGQTAYIIPYNGIATPVADYKGLIELITATRLVKHVNAKEIRKDDTFKYEEGDHPRITHDPHWQSKHSPIIGAYCSMPTVAGGMIQEVMNLEEIESIRASSFKWSPSKVRELPYWYARKTVIRRGAKYAPKSARLQQLIQFENDAGDASEEALDLIASGDMDALKLNAGAAPGAPDYTKPEAPRTISDPVSNGDVEQDEVVL